MSKAGTTGSCDSDHRSHTKGRQRKFPNKDLQSEQNWHHRFVDAFKPATSIGCQKKSFKSWQRIGCWSQRSPTTSPTQLLERDRTIFKNMPNYPTAPSPSATRHWPCEDCQISSPIDPKRRSRSWPSGFFCSTYGKVMITRRSWVVVGKLESPIRWHRSRVAPALMARARVPSQHGTKYRLVSRSLHHRRKVP